MKLDGVLRRVGPDKGGYWEMLVIVSKLNHVLKLCGSGFSQSIEG
jgi:hypothetical protein